VTDERCPDCQVHPSNGHLLGCRAAATDAARGELATPLTRFVDKLLYGAAYETADGVRIDPSRVR